MSDCEKPKKKILFILHKTPISLIHCSSTKHRELHELVLAFGRPFEAKEFNMHGSESQNRVTLREKMDSRGSERIKKEFSL